MSFESYLHPLFIGLIEKIQLQGFKVGVVGGAVRDFYLKATRNYDYDCELRVINPDDDAIALFEKLQFSEEYQIEKLPYNILRVSHPDFQCEFSLPRIEVYEEGNFSHSNFEAVFAHNLDYEEAFKRRDFTVNAMMYEFNGSWEFIDPFNGTEDLKSKKLVPCSESFYKDPVRFLRAIRFSILLDFEIDKRITDYMINLNWDNFSSHYMRYEALKTKKPITFFYQLSVHIGIELEDPFIEKVISWEKDIVDLRLHFSSLLFLSLTTRELLSEVFDYAIKTNEFIFPVLFKRLSHLSEKKLHQEIESNNTLIVAKALKSLPEVYYNLIEGLSLVDISYEEFHGFNKTKVEVSDIEFSQRSLYNFSRKLRSYFGS